MKFSDGYWGMRDGVRPIYPHHVHDAEADQGVLRVFAATKAIANRGDTLNAAIISIECHTPMADVIGVRINHHAGSRTLRPSFELAEDRTAEADIVIDDDAATLRAGNLEVSFGRGAPWTMSFRAGGRELTSSVTKAMAFLEVDDDGSFVREQLSLGVGEQVYGLGERFGAFVKNGQEVDIWNADGGTSSEQAYKNIPFYLTNRGYGVFVNDPGKVSFEVGSEVVSRVQFSVPAQTLEYFVIYGPTPLEVLRKYTALTGRPALPPAWSFGLWLTTSFTTSYDEQTVSSFVDGMIDRDIPLSVFHFDSFWMREFHWCDFEWDPRTFPDPVGMLARLKARGLKICVWINPYIAQRSALFAEGVEHGFLVTKPNGDVWQWDRWQAGMALVDFTNPDACAWYASKLKALMDMGVDCFKSDFGERIPTEVVWHDGSDPVRMHNYYTHLYNRTVFELLEKERGAGDAVLFARSATAGGQQFPVHWGGDCESTFESMAESLRGGLSLAASGFGFWSHDIGGFEGDPDPETFKRWIAFGLLSSHSRLHGSGSYRVPWAIDEQSVDVLREFTKLKARLMPYVYQAAVVAHTHGDPVMRPMVLAFPDDPGCAGLDRQFMLGPDILVAPIFNRDSIAEYYLPAGRWTHLLTGEVSSGPGWVREVCDIASVPVFARPGSVIAVGNHEDRPDYPYADGVTLYAFQLADDAEVTTVVPSLDGSRAATFVTTRQGDVIRVRRSGAVDGPWSVVVDGRARIGTPGEAAARADLPAGTEECVLTLT
jgi:alpha-D-xyloside xylohydrolase